MSLNDRLNLAETAAEMMKFPTGLILMLFLPAAFGVHASVPEYNSNPYTFSIQDSIWGWWECFFAVDLDNDSLMDFSYRSRTALYAYDHYGQFMWSAAIPYPGYAINNHCTKHGAADVDGDGQMEVVALNSANQIVVFNGLDGVPEDTLSVTVGPYQVAGHVAIVNLRGEGDRDVIVQTLDVTLEGAGIEYYLNRSLIAYRLDTHAELWRVGQDRNPANGLYEGYWGPAHGPFIAADVDGDGKDEVVGGNLVQEDGTVVDLGYPREWLSYALDVSYMDHLDAINVGDFRPDLPGLEWVVTEEGYTWDSWNTVMLSTSGILWRREATIFSILQAREPQNAATGNFSGLYPFSEVWLSSRGPTVFLDHQHPWVFDSGGTLRANYSMEERLPAGFNTHPNGNREGIEPIVAVDWFGLPFDQIAAVSRHVDGNFGVFDAMTGSAYWSTTGSVPAMQAAMLYAADVAGDSREEIIVYDHADRKVKIFWNGVDNPNQPKLSKWDDPLYRRLKQNWNYYQPGGYTYGDYPLISDIRIDSITTDRAVIAWTTDTASDSQVEFGEVERYGRETEKNPSLVTSHSVILSGLDPDTEIHFRVRSANAFGKLGLSKDTTFQTPPVLLSVRLFLEGPYLSSGDTMSAGLRTSGFIPARSPFAEDSVTASGIPANAVDWLLIQLRTEPSGAPVLSRSVFLLSDGTTAAPEGTAGPIKLKAHAGQYYLVIKHRNHLAVMSKTAQAFDSEGPGLYNFSTGTDRYYNDDAKLLETGVYGVYAGDANGSGTVDASDRSATWNDRNLSGYLGADCNLSGTVDASDRSITWNNRNKSTSVP